MNALIINIPNFTDSEQGAAMMNKDNITTAPTIVPAKKADCSFLLITTHPKTEDPRQDRPVALHPIAGFSQPP